MIITILEFPFGLRHLQLTGFAFALIEKTIVHMKRKARAFGNLAAALIDMWITPVELRELRLMRFYGSRQSVQGVLDWSARSLQRPAQTVVQKGGNST